MANKWWENSEVIRTKVAGVFEGGGAKGVAYVGALNAMKKGGFWFNAVAGSSAGALTALCIAAGLEPKEIEDKTIELLAGIKSKSALGNLWSLYNDRGFYPQKKMRQLLDALVEKQVHGEKKKDGETVDHKKVTFKDLYNATHIELNIVCADISQNQIRVFNHFNTPKCEVVDIALASSAIPFAFRSFDLYVPTKNKNLSRHIIVDGGVSSNFPIFVFKDQAFRKYSNYPDPNTPGKIVGFILKTKVPVPKSNFQEASFATNGALDISSLIAQENQSAEEQQENALLERSEKKKYKWTHYFIKSIAPIFSKNTWKNPLIGLITLVFGIISLMAWILNKVGKGFGELRWRPTKNLILNYFIETVNGLLGFLCTPIVLIIYILVICSIIWGYTIGQFEILTEISCIKESIFNDDPGSVLSCFWAVLIPFIKLLAAMVLGFVGIILLLLNALSLTTIRRLLYGLGKTYVSGSFATPWVEKMDEVIPLDIPDGLSVLSFKMDKKLRGKAIRSAQEKTENELLRFLKRWKKEKKISAETYKISESRLMHHSTLKL